MGCMFYYKSTPYFHVNEVALIGQFNNFIPTTLIKAKDIWFVEIDLPKGEHIYKFLINGVLKLNDPMARKYLPDQVGEIWSVAVVGMKRERLEVVNNSQLELLRHVITNRNSNTFDEARNKNSFDVNMDSSVVAGFEFGNVIGLHAITAVWVTPQLNMHHISEHSINVIEGDVNNTAEVWFWIPIQDKKREYPNGIWSIKLFIDGTFVMEIRFRIGKGGTYSVTNRGVEITAAF